MLHIKHTILVIMLLLMYFNAAYALKEIIKPDMSSSRKNVVEKQDELLAQIKSSTGKINNTKLGSLYGRVGMYYQAHEFNNSAKVSYENAIELSPFDYRWYHLKGFVEFSLGNFDEAVVDYKKVLEINPSYLASKVRWAELELERGEFDLATKIFMEILKVAPDFAKAYVGLGTIKMQRGESQEAIKHFERALKLQPNATQVNFLLSQAYASVGDGKKSKHFISLKGNREVVMYDKVLQDMHMFSLSPSYYAQASIHAFMNLDYVLAEKLAKHAMRLDPDDVNIKLIMLNIYISAKGKKEALDYVKKLSDKYPNDKRVRYSMAMVFEMVGDDMNAIKWYRKELSLDSNNKSTTILLAKALMRNKSYKKALVELRKSNKIEGENVYSIYAEAVLLAHFKVCDKSIKRFYDAISKRPKSFTYLTAFVKTVATCDVKDNKTKNDALNAARNMYSLSPTISITQALAMIEAALGNKSDAVDYQRQVVFQAISQKLPKKIIDIFNRDLEKYSKGLTARVPFKFFDRDLNPERSYSFYQ